MNKKRFYSDSRYEGNRGMGLVGVLVAAVIGALIIAALMQGVKDSSKAQKGVQGSLEFDNLKNSINLVLRSSARCREGIQYRPLMGLLVPAKFGPLVAAGEFNELVLSQGGMTSRIANVGQKLGAGLSVSRLALEYQTGFIAGTVVGANVQHNVQLIVEASKEQNISFGAQVLSNSVNPFKFMIETDGVSNDIVNCSSSDDEKYSTLCTDTGPWMGHICCQLEKGNGAIQCKRSPGGFWVAIPSPFAATSLGAYGASLNNNFGTALTLCRSNLESGATNCFQSGAPIAWVAAGSPF